MDNGHILEKIKKATQIQEIQEADDLLSQIMNAKKEIREIRKEARERTFKPKEGEPVKDPDNELALKTFDKEAKFLEIEGKVVGAFKGDKPQPDPNKLNEIPDEEIEKRAREILAKRK
jgi:hypothetical protein